MSGLIGSAGSKSGLLNWGLPFGIAKGNTNAQSSRSDYEMAGWTYVDQRTQSYFNNSTGRFTAPITGYYQFWFRYIKGNREATTRFYIRKNNSTQADADSAFQGRAEGTAENIADKWDTISDMKDAKPCYQGGEQSQKIFELIMKG